MSNLFLLLFTLCLFALIIGLINPRLVIRWGNKRGQKQVLQYYGWAIAVIVVWFILMTAPEPNRDKQLKLSEDIPKTEDGKEKKAEAQSTDNKERTLLRHLKENYGMPGYETTWYGHIKEVKVYGGDRAEIETDYYYGQSFSGGMDIDAIEPAKSICRAVIMSGQQINSAVVMGQGSRVITRCP